MRSQKQCYDSPVSENVGLKIFKKSMSYEQLPTSDKPRRLSLPSNLHDINFHKTLEIDISRGVTSPATSSYTLFSPSTPQSETPTSQLISPPAENSTSYCHFKFGGPTPKMTDLKKNAENALKNSPLILPSGEAPMAMNHLLKTNLTTSMNVSPKTRKPRRVRPSSTPSSLSLTPINHSRHFSGNASEDFSQDSLNRHPLGIQRPGSRRSSTIMMPSIDIVKDPIEIAKQGYIPLRCDPKMTGAFSQMYLIHWIKSGVKCLRVEAKPQQLIAHGFTSLFDLKPFLSYSLTNEEDLRIFTTLSKKIESTELSKDEVIIAKAEQEKMFFETLKSGLSQTNNKIEDLILKQTQGESADGAYVILLTTEGPMAFVGKGNHVLLASMSPYVIAAGDIYFVNESNGDQRIYLNASSGAYHHDQKIENDTGKSLTSMNNVESAKKAIAATFGEKVVYVPGNHRIPKNLSLPKISAKNIFNENQESIVLSNLENFKPKII